MPTRKAHNKTRLGCGQCKKRRIKCDGKRPTCANCDKKEFDCSFLLLVPSSALSSVVVVPAVEAAGTPEGSPPYEAQLIRHGSTSSPLTVLEQSPLSTFDDIRIRSPLKLPPYINFGQIWEWCKGGLTPRQDHVLNHYESQTSLTLATDGPAKLAWQTTVPEMASQYKFLIHGILSITCLHLGESCTDRHKRASLNRCATEQMNLTLAHFRVALQDIHEDNSAALFACATLTAVYFFRTSSMDMEDIRHTISLGVCSPPQPVVDRMIQSFVKTVWGLRGTLGKSSRYEHLPKQIAGGNLKLIAIAYPTSTDAHVWKWLQNDDKMSPICTRGWWPQHRVPQQPRAIVEDRRLADLQQLWEGPNSPDDETFLILSTALQSLRETFILVSLLTDPVNEYPLTNASVPYSVDDTSVGLLRDRAAILAWPTQISKLFIELVEQKNHAALVLVAHYAVLLGRIHSVWWLEGLGANTIWAVAVALGRENWHLVDWPACAVGVDLQNDSFGLGQVEEPWA